VLGHAGAPGRGLPRRSPQPPEAPWQAAHWLQWRRRHQRPRPRRSRPPKSTTRSPCRCRSSRADNGVSVNSAWPAMPRLLYDRHRRGGQTVGRRVVENGVKVDGHDVPKMFCLVIDLDDAGAYPYFAVETSFLPADPVCLAVSLSASGHRTSEASRSFSSTQISRALLSSCPFSTPCLAQVGSE